MDLNLAVVEFVNKFLLLKTILLHRALNHAGVKQGKAAVLQICANAARCHVMHIIHSGFPENLKSLLRDPRSVKVGESCKLLF